jgi:hypothetical protein
VNQARIQQKQESIWEIYSSKTSDPDPSQRCYSSEYLTLRSQRCENLKSKLILFGTFCILMYPWAQSTQDLMLRRRPCRNNREIPGEVVWTCKRTEETSEMGSEGGRWSLWRQILPLNTSPDERPILSPFSLPLFFFMSTITSFLRLLVVVYRYGHSYESRRTNKFTLWWNLTTL